MGELAFIALGSNIQPKRHLPLALRRLIELGRPLRVSAAYQSAPEGGRPQADYVNAAYLAQMDLESLALRQRLREIEAELGRVRTSDKYAPRPIDLDLVLHGDRQLQTADFNLPDPGLLTRAHIAVPIAELDPRFIHPQTGETLAMIASKLQPGARLRLRADVTRQLKELLPDAP